MDFSLFRVSAKFKNIFEKFFFCMHRFCGDEVRFLQWAGIFYFPDSRLGGKLKFFKFFFLRALVFGLWGFLRTKSICVRSARKRLSGRSTRKGAWSAPPLPCSAQHRKGAWSAPPLPSGAQRRQGARCAPRSV